MLQIGMSHHKTVADFLTDRLKSDVDEPIGHRLIQNAYELTGTDPQAAILLAVTAFEVGVKDFIARHVPKAHWLAFNAPTPPLERMIQEYLPDLAMVDKADFATVFARERIESLRKYVHLRNTITHQGREVTTDQAREACDALYELLYCLDYARGESWAKPKPLKHDGS